jgi:hypothetical protein
MHPLDGAHEQVNGAREHLDDLRPEIDVFTQEIADSISLNYRRGFIKINGKHLLVPIGTAGFPINRPASPKTRRLIGEVIQPLRKSLEYLAYELVRFDSKITKEQTQFIIVNSPEKFRSNMWRLDGLTPEHIVMFERLQPYNGCNWTKLIRDLSNPDKHKTLTAIKHPVAFSIDPNNTEAILSGENVSMDKYASIKVTFNNGLPVIEGLEQLVSDVARTIHLFDFEFF